jgi:hypothetical protein
MHRVSVAIFLISSVLFAAPVHARTWNIQVDGLADAPTVQAGIDSAAVGDTVLVYPGTYDEAIVFRGRDIVVRSAAGPEQTILDADGLGTRTVGFGENESRAALLEGFTITHGRGGVIVIDAEPSIVGNVIIDNSSAQNGGGIWCIAGDFNVWRPLIMGNTVVGNSADNLAGGIGFLQLMVPEVVENHISGNLARDGDGGGIYYRSLDDGAIIRGNTVVSNQAGDHGGGIYAALIGSPLPALQLEISWNLIANNRAAGSDITGESGGGITLIETDAWVHHNTIVGNEGGATPTTLGGGIAVERIGSPLIEMNIIALTTQGGGVFCLKGATPMLQNNLAWQNMGGDGLGECADWTTSNGNLVADPYFCDAAAGNYTLAADSPALTHPASPLGCFDTPGCGPLPVLPTTWGALKSRYSTPN